MINHDVLIIKKSPSITLAALGAQLRVIDGTPRSSVSRFETRMTMVIDLDSLQARLVSYDTRHSPVRLDGQNSGSKNL